MEVIVVDSKIFKRIEELHQEAIEKMLEAKKDAVKNSFTLLTAQEVADMTKLDVTTILKRKHEIGFISLGNKNLFELADIVSFFRAHKVSPKKKLL